MSEWIEINLPWDMRLPFVNDEIPLFLHDRLQKQFGKTLDELLAEITDAQSIYNEEFSRVESELDPDNDCLFDLTDQINSKLFNTEAAVNITRAIAKHKEAYGWLCSQPEYTDWRKELDEKDAAAKAEAMEKSFCGRSLNKPGVLIVTADNEQYLIGNINVTRGVCDDCTAFDYDTVIKKYKVVWEPELAND